MTDKAKEHSFSEFAMLRDEGQAHLVVALAGVDQKPGTFPFYRVLTGNHSTLFLNCPDNGWYVDGVPLGGSYGLSPNLERTLDFLQDFCANYDQVSVIGSSMGGYGALLFGAHISGAKILSMSPEIYAGIRTGFFQKASLIKGTPFCLSSLFKDPSFQPTIVSGEKKFADIYQLVEIKGRSVVTIKNGFHTTAPVVNRHFRGMSAAVEALVNGTFIEKISALSGKMLEWPDVVSALYYSEIGCLRSERLNSILDSLPTDLYVRGYLLIEMSKFKIREGNNMIAFDLARQSLDANPFDLEAHLVHDSLFRDIYGHLPTAIWTKYISDAFLNEPRFSSIVTKLTELHGSC